MNLFTLWLCPMLPQIGCPILPQTSFLSSHIFVRQFFATCWLHIHVIWRTREFTWDSQHCLARYGQKTRKLTFQPLFGVNSDTQKLPKMNACIVEKAELVVTILSLAICNTLDSNKRVFACQSMVSEFTPEICIMPKKFLSLTFPPPTPDWPRIQFSCRISTKKVTSACLWHQDRSNILSWSIND